MAAVAAWYDRFRELGVQVISVSADTVFVHKGWHEQDISKMLDGDVPFPMVGDPAGKVGRAYGVFDPEYGVDFRSHFIIDPDGVVVSLEVLFSTVGRNVDEMLRQVQCYQHVRSTGGKEATPANWRPGKQTLCPGPALVGKVCEVWKPEK